jgi:hypothetical protein
MNLALRAPIPEAPSAPTTIGSSQLIAGVVR